MSMSNGEAATKNLTDKAQERFENERLEKEVNAVKNDIAALTDQITDAINSFAGTATKQARRGYRQVRDNAEQAVDDMSERGGAMMDGAHADGSSAFDVGQYVIYEDGVARLEAAGAAGQFVDRGIGLGAFDQAGNDVVLE